MAPFPESEDMTIKRLVVALRKNDLQLLKMGAYKLHEKFHTGYDFELTDDLKKILEYVQAKHIPPEVSDILCSTIKEILNKKNMEDNSAQLTEAINSTDVTIDIEGAVEDALKETQNNNQYTVLRNTYYDVPNSTKPAKPVIEPIINPLNAILNQNPVDNAVDNAISQLKDTTLPLNSTVQNNIDPDDISLAELSAQTQKQIEMQKTQPEPVQEQVEQVKPNITSEPATRQEENTKKLTNNKNPLDDILIFYDDYKNETDYSKVKEYRNNLNFLFAENNNYQDYNILKQIASLTNIMDTEIAETDKIISTLSTLKSKISFVTTSQSQNISKVFTQKEIDFEIPFVKKAQNEKNAFNLVPMLGFTNIFVCSNCNSRSLKTDFNTRTLSVQCPRCDSASFPDIYAVNSYNPDCNPIFWHRAFAAFVKSKTWILINPPLDENKEIIFDFIKAAFEAGKPETIYMLSKENDKKEVYKQMFLSIDSNVQIKSSYTSQDKLCEEFIKEEITKKVFN